MHAIMKARRRLANTRNWESLKKALVFPSSPTYSRVIIFSCSTPHVKYEPMRPKKQYVSRMHSLATALLAAFSFADCPGASSLSLSAKQLFTIAYRQLFSKWRVTFNYAVVAFVDEQLTRSFQILGFFSIFVDQNSGNDYRRISDAVDGQME